MKGYRGKRVITPFIPNFGIRSRWVVNPWGMDSNNHLIGQCIGSRVDLNIWEKNKSLLPTAIRTPDRAATSVVHGLGTPGTSLPTDITAGHKRHQITMVE
jgi:hypothetical protein